MPFRVAFQETPASLQEEKMRLFRGYQIAFEKDESVTLDAYIEKYGSQEYKTYFFSPLYEDEDN